MRFFGLILAALLASTSFAAASCPNASSDCPALSTSQINLGGAIVNQSGVPFIPPAALPTAAGQVLTTTDTTGRNTTWTTPASGGTPGGTSGQIQFNNNSAFGGLPTGTTGASVVLQTGSGGTVAASVLPAPSASTLGGVQSAAAVSHQWISGISTLGVPVLSQPAFGDLSGTPTTLSGYGITNAMPLAGGTFTGTVAHGSNQVSGSNFTISGGTLSGVVVGATTLSATGATTTAGITDSGGINTTATTGFRIGGANGLSLSVGPSGQQAIFVGPGAGSYILNNGLNTGFGGVAIGQYSGASISSSGGEFALGGAYAGQYMTTAYAATGWGEHVIGYDNCNYCSAFGNDVMRDTVGNTNSTAAGAQSQDDGVGNNNTSAGFQAIRGNAGSVIFTGTATSGDRNCVPFTSTNANVTGLPASACYTTQSGDTLASVATGLSSAMSALAVTTPGGGPAPGNGVSMAADVAGTATNAVLRFHFPGGNTAGWAISAGTPTCTGTCTEVLTVQAPFSVTDSIGIGVSALNGFALSGGSGLIGIGDYTMQALQGSGNTNGICVGIQCGSGLYGVNSSILMGQNVLSSSGGTYGYTSTHDIILVTNAFMPTSYTGSENTILNGNIANFTGNMLGSVVIGWNSALPAAGNWQLNIQDAIYGTNNNKAGGGPGTGQIALEMQVPTTSYQGVFLGGEAVVGGGTALAATATTGFFHLPFTTAAPTGTPANVVGNSCEINTATESLNCYIGSAWYHVALTSGAN